MHAGFSGAVMTDLGADVHSIYSTCRTLPLKESGAQ